MALLEEPVELACALFALVLCSPNGEQSLDGLGLASSQARPGGAGARRGIVGLQPKRAEVILAGACIVRTIMDKLGQQTLTVSDRDLRHVLLVLRSAPDSG